MAVKMVFYFSPIGLVYHIRITCLLASHPILFCFVRDPTLRLQFLSTAQHIFQDWAGDSFIVHSVLLFAESQYLLAMGFWLWIEKQMFGNYRVSSYRDWKLPVLLRKNFEQCFKEPGLQILYDWKKLNYSLNYFHLLSWCKEIFF